MVAVGRFSLSFALALAFSLPFLVAAHLLVLLDCAVPILHFALAVVRRTAAAAVEVLAVHACSARQDVSKVPCSVIGAARRYPASQRHDGPPGASGRCPSDAGSSSGGRAVAMRRKPQRHDRRDLQLVGSPRPASIYMRANVPDARRQRCRKSRSQAEPTDAGGGNKMA